MSKQPNQDQGSYGARFAEAWELLQRYLADLDSNELGEMARADSEETLALLRKQPALGLANAVRKASNKSPEDLAIAIIQERLDALKSGLAPESNAPWGARFLTTWRENGGPLSIFNYAQIQEMKQADQEQAIRLLRKKLVNNLSYLQRKLLIASDPELAARELLRQMQISQMSVSHMLF